MEMMGSQLLVKDSAISLLSFKVSTYLLVISKCFSDLSYHLQNALFPISSARHVVLTPSRSYVMTVLYG